jgi:hypothetical protein
MDKPPWCSHAIPQHTGATIHLLRRVAVFMRCAVRSRHPVYTDVGSRIAKIKPDGTFCMILSHCVYEVCFSRGLPDDIQFNLAVPLLFYSASKDWTGRMQVRIPPLGRFLVPVVGSAARWCCADEIRRAVAFLQSPDAQ